MKINMIIPLLLLSNAFNVPNNLVPNLVRYESVGLVSAQSSPCENKVCVKDCCDTLGICKSTGELEATCLVEKTTCVEACQILAGPNCKVVANC